MIKEPTLQDSDMSDQTFLLSYIPGVLYIDTKY
jgi:hypothetical protein